MAKKKEIDIRSSASEYLTYVSAVGNNADSIEMRYEDENIWLTQKMMAVLYGVTVSAINLHIKKIYEDNELEPSSTIKKYLIVQEEGGRQVARNGFFYSQTFTQSLQYFINGIKRSCFAPCQFFVSFLYHAVKLFPRVSRPLLFFLVHLFFKAILNALIKGNLTVIRQLLNEIVNLRSEGDAQSCCFHGAILHQECTVRQSLRHAVLAYEPHRL